MVSEMKPGWVAIALISSVMAIATIPLFGAWSLLPVLGVLSFVWISGRRIALPVRVGLSVALGVSAVGLIVLLSVGLATGVDHVAG